MDEDEGLKRIRLKKLEKCFRRKALKIGSESLKKREKAVPIKSVDLTDVTFKEAVQNNPLVVIGC